MVKRKVHILTISREFCQFWQKSIFIQKNCAFKKHLQWKFIFRQLVPKNSQFCLLSMKKYLWKKILYLISFARKVHISTIFCKFWTNSVFTQKKKNRAFKNFQPLEKFILKISHVLFQFLAKSWRIYMEKLRFKKY